MSKINSTSRRRFCLSLVSLPVLAGCGAGTRPATQPKSQAPSGRVAMLLPLSGPRAGLGQTMAKSVWLAEDLSAALTRAKVFDAGDTTATAAAAASDAVAAGADVIIGPLFRDQVPSVLEAAGRVPVLTLSNDTALAGQGAWVFGVTPEQSARAVLRYAKDAGGGRITMLETGGALGARAQAALSAGAEAARSSILTSVPARTTPAEMRVALRRAAGGTLPDILYVPTAGAPALEQAVAAVGAGVTTIGSLQWSGLPKVQFKRLDKACFTGPDPQRFDRLSASFQARLDEDMGVIGALAVDALAYAQTAGPGLIQRQPVEGLLGATQFRRDRTCARNLSVLRINGGSVVRVA
ncbi:MAG: penicillin-binding protein activator [Pseudomonadota bacterium]